MEKYMEKHAFSDFIGIELLEVTPEKATGKLVNRKELTDHLGHMTGGAYNALADAVGGAAARATGDLYVTQGCSLQYYVSTELGVDDVLYAKAVIRHRGSRSCIAAVELIHEDGTVACDGQFTYAKVVL